MLTHAVFDTLTGDQITRPMTEGDAITACERLGGQKYSYAVKWVQSAPVVKPAEKSEPDAGPGLFD